MYNTFDRAEELKNNWNTEEDYEELTYCENVNSMYDQDNDEGMDIDLLEEAFGCFY